MYQQRKCNKLKRWGDIVVKDTQSLLETMRIIDETSLQFAIVVDEENHLLGTVTDGDIRRGILRGEGLEVPISTIMNTTPITAKSNLSISKYKQLMKSKKLKYTISSVPFDSQKIKFEV